MPEKRKVAFKKEVKIKNITVFQNYRLYYLNNKSHRFPFLQKCLDFQDLSFWHEIMLLGMTLFQPSSTL